MDKIEFIVLTSAPVTHEEVQSKKSGGMYRGVSTLRVMVSIYQGKGTESAAGTGTTKTPSSQLPKAVLDDSSYNRK